MLNVNCSFVWPSYLLSFDFMDVIILVYMSVIYSKRKIWYIYYMIKASLCFVVISFNLINTKET